MMNLLKRIFKKSQPAAAENLPAKDLPAAVDQQATENLPGAEAQPAGMGQPAIPAAKAGVMLQMIANTQETEIACDEAHRLLDQYAEMALRGEDTARLLPLVHQHLAMCPDCREEFEALMRVLQDSAE